jgi:cob(I)alamin adenosyltransferase
MAPEQDNADVAPREFSGPTDRTRRGIIAVYTGDGKGKSTAGFGAALRALGRGMDVAVVQFMKGPWVSGEFQALEKFGAHVEVHKVGEGFTWDTKDLERDKACARAGWDLCLKLLRESRHGLYLFDEILYVLKYRFLPAAEIVAGLALKPPLAHLILTGRDAPPEIVAAADLVTEMREIKHPYRSGITAQAGFDY